MEFDKPYPYNLINDLMLGEPFNSELDEAEIPQEVENILLSLSEIYTVNKYIPKKMQTIIRLWYGEGLTYKEIGKLLGIS